jgi:hypothetical protein
VVFLVGFAPSWCAGHHVPVRVAPRTTVSAVFFFNYYYYYYLFIGYFIFLYFGFVLFWLQSARVLGLVVVF